MCEVVITYPTVYLLTFIVLPFYFMLDNMSKQCRNVYLEKYFRLYLVRVSISRGQGVVITIHQMAIKCPRSASTIDMIYRPKLLVLPDLSTSCPSSKNH
jgi:hypothetical protein